MLHFDRAGGVQAIMQRLSPKLHLDQPTVNGNTIGENLDEFDIVNPKLNKEIIATLEKPIHAQGGIAVLKGSLAPDGSVVKQAAVDPRMHVHTGPARVYDCEEDAMKAILAGLVQPGDIVVIRYEGPKGGPGMREMLAATAARFTGLLAASRLAASGLFTTGLFAASGLGTASFLAAGRFRAAALVGLAASYWLALAALRFEQVLDVVEQIADRGRMILLALATGLAANRLAGLATDGLADLDTGLGTDGLTGGDLGASICELHKRACRLA